MEQRRSYAAERDAQIKESEVECASGMEQRNIKKKLCSSEGCTNQVI